MAADEPAYGAGGLGHRRPQTVLVPPGHTSAPLLSQQVENVHAAVPAFALGQCSKHDAPAMHCAAQAVAPSLQVNSQVLSWRHRQIPSPQTASQRGLLPSQLTLQGGLLQPNVQVLPMPQVQKPSAHVALQLEIASHLALQGGLLQVNSQLLP